jgi:hypothetical protein
VFTVTAPATDPITDFHLLLNGLVGPVLDVATLSNGVTLSSSDNLEHAISFAPVTSLKVSDDIGVNPGGSVSILDKQFSQTPVPGAGCGCGIAGSSYSLRRASGAGATSSTPNCLIPLSLTSYSLQSVLASTASTLCD